MYLKDKLIEFENSVIELASKLPQWNSEDINRRLNSAGFSLLEEAGEISGLVSKKRIRKNYWKVNPKDLDDFIEIRKTFIGELSDFLWVLVCTNSVVFDNDNNTKLNIVEELLHYYNIAKRNIELELYKISSLEQELNNLFLNVLYNFNNKFSTIFNIVNSFCNLLAFFWKEYDITLEELIDYNMEKLGKRYNEKGERVDGK